MFSVIVYFNMLYCRVQKRFCKHFSVHESGNNWYGQQNIIFLYATALPDTLIKPCQGLIFFINKQKVYDNIFLNLYTQYIINRLYM